MKNSKLHVYPFRHYLLLAMSLSLAVAGFSFGLKYGTIVSFVGGAVGIFVFIMIIIMGRTSRRIDEKLNKGIEEERLKNHKYKN